MGCFSVLLLSWREVASELLKDEPDDWFVIVCIDFWHET